MNDNLKQPRGDSHGSLGETVVLRLKPRRLRTLRERQLALLVLCTGISVAIIDGSAVSVALPSIQTGLGFSQSNLAWVINAYLIPFGGLLLFAGRLGDLIGTKRVFIAGVGLFTAASVACGLAQDQAVLIGSRFVQGIGGALATAVVLSMIVTMFPKPREQARALGLYAFVASSAAAIGLFAGAVLTDTLSWHWIFFVNVPIGALTILFAHRLLDNVRDSHGHRGIDWFGAITLVTAVMLGVYTIVYAADHGWDNQRAGIVGVSAAALLAVFAAWQARAKHPLVPRSVLRARNVAWSNVVLALMVVGPGGMFFLCALYLRYVLNFSVIELGVAFLPAAASVGVGSLKIAPKLLKRLDAKAVMVPAMVLLVAGLLLFARIPADGVYLVDILPPLLLIGLGSGLATPPVLQLALAEATMHDSGVRSGLVNTTQQIGSALGLAILAPVSANVANRALADGASAAVAMTDGSRVAFLVGAATTVAAIVLAVLFVQSEVPKTAPNKLDAPVARARTDRSDPTGAADPDFLALGMGATNMMAMLWSIATGRRAVGVELRGDPYLNVMHWNVSEDVYHHLALVDDMMIKRYGEERLPKLGDGQLFRLSQAFYRPEAVDGGDARADEVISGWIRDACTASVVESVEEVDDRWVAGKPHREVRRYAPKRPSAVHDPATIGRDIADVLSEPEPFLVGGEELLIVLRRYLQEIERMDLAAGVTPRCRMFTYHRVVAHSDRRSARLLRRLTGRGRGETGFSKTADGRVRVQIEAIRELDEKGRYFRVRERGTKVIDLGVPKLMMIAEGVNSPDARRLGFKQQPAKIDHGDGRGPVLAHTVYVMGLIGIYIDNHRRKRIASVFDSFGNEHWVRQVGIGHEGFVESGWILTEVPDFMTFDPVAAGLVASGTSKESAAYVGTYRNLIREYYLEQAALLTEISKEKLAKTYSLSMPRLVGVTRMIGTEPKLASNCVVAGDSFGNGSFLASGGATTGMVGHAVRVLRYWQAIDEGVRVDTAISELAAGIKHDTEVYLALTEHDFAQPPAPAMAPGERTAYALRMSARERVATATRRYRRSVGRVRVDHRDDWSRLQVFPGRLEMVGLQPLPPTHPDQRMGGGESAAVAAHLLDMSPSDGAQPDGADAGMTMPTQVERELMMRG